MPVTKRESPSKMLEKKNARLDLRMHARAKHDLREGGKELLVKIGSGNNAHAK